jgi:hypothetical protein
LLSNSLMTMVIISYENNQEVRRKLCPDFFFRKNRFLSEKSPNMICLKTSRRTGSPGLIKSFVIWTTSRLNHTKTWKRLGKIYIRPMIELQQCEYDAASQRFRDLRVAFKEMYRLKYAQYVERVEAGLKSNTRCFFRFAILKRNSSGYPSAMFLGDTCARNA